MIRYLFACMCAALVLAAPAQATSFWEDRSVASAKVREVCYNVAWSYGAECGGTELNYWGVYEGHRGWAYNYWFAWPPPNWGTARCSGYIFVRDGRVNYAFSTDNCSDRL